MKGLPARGPHEGVGGAKDGDVEADAGVRGQVLDEIQGGLESLLNNEKGHKMERS